MSLRLGDEAPNFTAETTKGIINFHEWLGESWGFFFSHPADYTPVCTTEFVAFQKRYGQFRELGCELIGMSVDQVFAHIKWEEWIKDKLGIEIEFPIIADTGAVATKLGLVHPGKGTNTVRAVFVVDDRSKIRTILYYPQELGRNMDEVVRIVKAMQISDANGVAMPANWPNNELFGDHVIVPPATTVEAARERMAKAQAGEHECLDWWLCHKAL